MEKVLITGATGLIGREVLALLEDEYDCWIIGRRPVSGKRIHFIEQDIGKPFDLSKFPEQVDYVIHLAQSDNHNDLESNRKELFNVNVYGMLQLLDYGIKAKIKKFLFASSGGVYSRLDKAVSEDDVLTVSNALNFYQNTKLCMEILSQNYQEFFDVITFRFFFVYGTGQKANMLFPRLIESVREKGVITIGSLDDIRINPIYITDAAQCVLKALKNIHRTQTFNIAGSEITCLGTIIKKISQKIGVDAEIKYEDKKQQDTVADIQKMQSLLWKPQVRLDEGIGRVLEAIK